MSTRRNTSNGAASKRLYSYVARTQNDSNRKQDDGAKQDVAPHEVIPPVVTEKPVCAPPTEPVTVREAQEAKPDLCAINTMVNAQMKSIPIDELEKRPGPGKLTVVYAHGSTLINEYFVVPKGYYFYFDSVKSESTSLKRSGEQDYTDESGVVHRLDPFESGILKPETRHTAIDKSIFMHQYAPGDVMTNHTFNFYPGESHKHLTKTELKKDGNIKIICGIIRPNMIVNPIDFYYTTSGLNETFITFPELDSGKIPFSANTTLYDIINKGITLSNGQVYKLQPGHIVLKSCRKLLFGKRNNLTGEIYKFSINAKIFNNMHPRIQNLTRMPSTGKTNNFVNARKPSNTKKTQPKYATSLLFRSENQQGQIIRQSMPMSSALANKSSNKSSVYVTNYVRQEFPSKIERYNTKILKSFNDKKYTPKPEFKDIFPYNTLSHTYKPIDPSGILTPYDVYNVIIANTCHVCMRNLAKLTGNSACKLCKIVGFCAEHKGAPSYEIAHDCVISFYTEDEMREIKKNDSIFQDLKKKITDLINDINVIDKAIDKAIKESYDPSELLMQRDNFLQQVKIYKTKLMDTSHIMNTSNVMEIINKKHIKAVQAQAKIAKEELAKYEAERHAEQKAKDNKADKLMKQRMQTLFT